jgi:ATP-dependent Lon protease
LKINEKVMPHSIEELMQKIVSASIPSHIRQIAHRELELLSEKNPDSEEYANKINYIDYLVGVPWSIHTESNTDLKKAETIFNERCAVSHNIRSRIFKYMAANLLGEDRIPRILVVDDEKIALRNMEHALKKEDYMVVAANSGAEAVQRLDESEFDVVITDLIMGEIDGHTVLKKTRDKYPGSKVIMITGYATVDTAVEAMRKGAFHYIEKPIRLNEVRAAVKEALRQKCLSESSKGSALCFVGPAGSGKTSAGEAVAEALGKKFVEISLDNISNESDIMGCRRSEKGAKPGCIVEGIQKAGVSNPVVLLKDVNNTDRDIKYEILIKVIDSGQNCNFIDRYLEVPFDLSNVVFIVTAKNSDNIPGSLKEFLEIIEIQD